MNRNIWVIIVLIVMAAGCGRSGNAGEAVGAEPVVQEAGGPEADGLIREAIKFEEQQNVLEARDAYAGAFENVTNPQQLDYLNEKVEELNMKVLFSRTVDKDSILYTVVSGDSLDKIARKHGTTVELLKKSNGLTSDVIQVGQKLKVVTAKFSIFVDKSQNVLFLKKGDEILKTYRVATGKDNSTPIGEFTIITRLKNPVHFRRDISAAVPAGSPQNILGTRWMGIDVPGYGIHGHAVTDDIGKQVTLGCVRMLDREVEELYDIVPQGARVIIVD